MVTTEDKCILEEEPETKNTQIAKKAVSDKSRNGYIASSTGLKVFLQLCTKSALTKLVFKGTPDKVYYKEPQTAK